MKKHLELSVLKESNHLAKSKRDKWFYALDTRIKLALLVTIILLNIGLAISWLSSLLLLAGVFMLYSLNLFTKRILFFFLVPLYSTVLIVAGYGIGFGSTKIFNIGAFSFYLEGLKLGFFAAIRIYCDIIWLALTFSTSSFTSVLDALRWYRIPPILVDTLSMMYRYSFLIFEEFTRMRLASYSRGGNVNFKKNIHSVGRIVSQLFMRIYDRSERIYWAMFARGGERP